MLGSRTILLGWCVLCFVALATGAEPPASVRKLAQTIDHHVAARCTEEKVALVGRSTDAEFLRRAYLDVTGAIPPVAEVRRFLADPAPDKRTVLIDRLLAGPGYVRHASARWRELLSPDDAERQQPALAALETWLQRQFANDVPYDQLARAVLTLSLAETPLRPGAAGNEPTPRLFYLGRENKPDELAAAMTRRFLGVRLECAQCHNHPHAKWTRADFWSQAAFFVSLRQGKDARELMIPGEDRKVAARFLDGAALPADAADARQALAGWLTAADNPYFARAAVNRLWEQFFGVGLVDPVDDLIAENPPSHPALLDELAREFVAVRFDLKFVTRAIMLSETYQRTSVESRAGAAPDPRLFSRMNVKALTPAELLDSLIEATAYRAPNLARQRAALLARFPQSDRRLEGQSSIPQALALMNGELLAAAIRPDGDNTLAALLASPFLDTDARVEALFLAALSRPPRADEKARLVKYVTSGGASGNTEKALGDVFWALLNSAEFIHNH